MKLETRKLTFTAIICALNLMFLYVAFLTPTAEIAFYAASTVLMAFVVYESGIKAGFLGYAVVSILGLVFIPDKLFMLSYILFGGYYPMAKWMIESKINSSIYRWVSKIIIGIIGFFVLLLTAKALFANAISILPTGALFIAFVGVFILYDMAFTQLIGFYIHRIHDKVIKK